MRWSSQTIEAEESSQLPGYRDAAVVRRFDAPEALDTRFYEVFAKSVLNRVPEKSRMPFRWTINPYRGCSHACTYCISGDTPILLGDGTHKPMEQVRPGDEIYGTSVEGRFRRLRRTTVLDHWSTVKPAYRTTLSDGTELITSADHRFLSRRGWKHVTDAAQGRRPHLTSGQSLLGTGGFAHQPEASTDYRRGYLTAMVRGDGHAGSDHHERADGGVHRFPLAFTDEEGRARTEHYLALEDVAVSRSALVTGTDGQRPINAIRTQARGPIARIQELVRWPLSPSDDWRKGFLAGIFDAEGAGSKGEALRICNGDPLMLSWSEDCLRHFGFTTVRDRRAANGCVNIRIHGGLPERLRFLHLTDPAIARKRDMDGVALTSSKQIEVVSVEPLGLSLRLFDITTGTGDFISDGVVSHNCFARPTHTYLDFDAGRDFEREIVVKVNAPEVAAS